jgi:hypothetical protein
MPLTRKGEKILHAMVQEYGPKKGKSVFYASANKGTIKGVHHSPPTPAEEAAHQSLAKEVAGGLRSFTFARIRQDQPGPPYRE